jgi:LmbE family N-acetylglucosaminyl deacetylase
LLAQLGHIVHACIVSADVGARQHRPGDDRLRSHTLDASEALGFREPILGSFPNIQLNTVPHLELVQFIEQAIEATGATTIFTHHPGDLNDDHLHVARACRAAARLSRRREGVPALRALYHMEILSSTDWAFRSDERGFEPDTFVEIGETFLARKLAALRVYEGVMRRYPHSRSEEAIRAQATVRGAQGHLQLAEAFQTAFRVLTPGSLV